MKLRFLTYNMAMLPGLLGTAKNERAEKFVEAILNKTEKYDFICLQEVFDENIRQYYLNHLTNEYPYIIDKCYKSENDLINQDSGLFFASRHPIQDYKFAFYKNSTFLTADAFADKGVLMTRFEFGSNENSKLLYVFSTHLQSSLSHYETRKKQLKQLREFIETSLLDRKKIRKVSERGVVLLGDFNVVGDNKDEYREYGKMLEILKNPIDLFRTKNPGDSGETWNAIENLFIQHTAPKDTDFQRLDYIFTYKTIPMSDRYKGNPVPLMELECETCQLFKPKYTYKILNLFPESDLSDHYGLEAVIDFPAS